jgi:hypothetical protein
MEAYPQEAFLVPMLVQPSRRPVGEHIIELYPPELLKGHCPSELHRLCSGYLNMYRCSNKQCWAEQALELVADFRTLNLPKE